MSQRSFSGWNDGRYPAELAEAKIPRQSVKLGRLYISESLWTLDGLINLSSDGHDNLREVIATFRPDVIVLTGVEFAFTVMYVVPRNTTRALPILRSCPTSERLGDRHSAGAGSCGGSR